MSDGENLKHVSSARKKKINTNIFFWFQKREITLIMLPGS